MLQAKNDELVWHQEGSMGKRTFALVATNIVMQWRVPPAPLQSVPKSLHCLLAVSPMQTLLFPRTLATTCVIIRASQLVFPTEVPYLCFSRSLWILSLNSDLLTSVVRNHSWSALSTKQSTECLLKISRLFALTTSGLILDISPCSQ